MTSSVTHAIERPPVPPWFPARAAIADWLAGREPIYRWRAPRYLLCLLEDLAVLMPDGPCRVLDIGAGSGLVGEAVARFFPGKTVTALDVRDRFRKDLTIARATFDGRTIPFSDGAFECALFNNVMHHVPRADRATLLAEARRITGGGCIVIKDHLAASILDRARLVALDLIGNLPFGGMVKADYLTAGDWDALFACGGLRGERLGATGYREGLASRIFPDRLEVSFRLQAALV